MPMFVCDTEGCSRPSVRTYGECILCNLHLCSKHLQPEFHCCPKYDDADSYDPKSEAADKRELKELLGKINTSALAARASHLRNGTACSISPFVYEDRGKRYTVMGGMNYHVGVCFEDGVKWLARIRRFNSTSAPPILRDYIIKCEVATLRFLENTGVPSPRVFDFALEESDNGVGVGYILMEKLPGTPFAHTDSSESEKEKVIGQLADVYIELRKYPFETLGSLDTPGTPHVGPIAREPLTDFTTSGMVLPGPFSSLEETHRHEIHLVLDLILREEMYFPKAVDAYLVHLFLLDIIPSVLPAPQPSDQKFYLTHADDKGDHILVDEDYNITGIIDWEWAHTAPLALAFNSPLGFLDVADFYDGVNDMSDDEKTFARILEEKGSADLAAYVRAGRLQHRFKFCCGGDLIDWSGFLGLFKGLREAVKVDDGLDWNEWKAVALARYKEDAGLQELLARERGDVVDSGN